MLELLKQEYTFSNLLEDKTLINLTNFLSAVVMAIRTLIKTRDIFFELASPVTCIFYN